MLILRELSVGREYGQAQGGIRLNKDAFEISSVDFERADFGVFEADELPGRRKTISYSTSELTTPSHFESGVWTRSQYDSSEQHLVIVTFRCEGYHFPERWPIVASNLNCYFMGNERSKNVRQAKSIA